MKETEFPRELVEIAERQLNRNAIDFETLFALRKFMGYWNEIEETFGIEFLRGIDAITSECDFDRYPRQEDLDCLAPEQRKELEIELATYFKECSVDEIFRAIFSQKC